MLEDVCALNVFETTIVSNAMFIHDYFPTSNVETIVKVKCGNVLQKDNTRLCPYQ